MSCSSSSPPVIWPALFTSRSIVSRSPPRASKTRIGTHGSKDQPHGADLRDPFTGSNLPVSRVPASTKRSGRAARASVIARPMPRFAPVTRAVAPERSTFTRGYARHGSAGSLIHAEHAPVPCPMPTPPRTATLAVLTLCVAYGAGLVAVPARLARRWSGRLPTSPPRRSRSEAWERARWHCTGWQSRLPCGARPCGHSWLPASQGTWRTSGRPWQAAAACPRALRRPP